MFKIKANPTFEADVKIPSPEGEQVLRLVFKHKTRKQVAEYFPSISKEDVTEGQALSEIVADWKDVDQPFSIDALVELTQEYHAAIPAIYDAYVSALTQAKQGN